MSPVAEEWTVPTKIADALVQFEGDETLVVLPSLFRGDDAYYSSDDIHAVRLINSDGIPTTLLHKQDRKFLTEMSAGVLVTVVLAIVGNLSTDALVGVARYVRDRAGFVLTKRLAEPGTSVEVEVKIARFERSADGAVTLNGLQVRGSAMGAALAVVAALADPPGHEVVLNRVAELFEEGNDLES